jgi:hypothetical protein
MWEPRRLATLWDFTTCYRDSFIFTFKEIIQDLSDAVNLDTYWGPLQDVSRLILMPENRVRSKGIIFGLLKDDFSVETV